MAEPFSQEVDTGEDCVVITEGCEATIGLFEQCIEANTAASLAVIDLLDCSTATLNGDPLANVNEPASCDQLNTECPELFGN